MKKTKFGIVGCGRISKRHLEVLTNLENAEVAAVCDIIKEKSEDAGKKYNVPYYLSYDEMLTKHRDIEVVNILLPSGLHASAGIDIIEKYKKHLVIEKPMALRMDEADKLISSANENNIKLFVVKQNRYNLPVKKLKEAVVSGKFGKIVLATVRVRWCRDESYYKSDNWRGTWKYDGGVLTNQASHHIDLLQWLAGPVESVIAKTTTALNNIEVEDTAAVIMKFQSGALGIVEATTCARPVDLEGSLSILGECGTVEISGFAVNKMKTWIFKNELKEESENVIKEFQQNPPNVYGFGHSEYLKNVIECVQKNVRIPVDGIEGRKSIELINAIYESVETGKEVYIHFKPKYCKLGY
ncbi:Gfo/Idh/MocA family oxidoreductase [Candidatus Dependentiae bacterium]|nr:Gfo/Idh/MocA family oxidoreductase [Candidatus Dependentiae bacterium]